MPLSLIVSCNVDRFRHCGAVDRRYYRKFNILFFTCSFNQRYMLACGGRYVVRCHVICDNHRLVNDAGNSEIV